jgi:SAM-dependent methyltransferase
MHPEAYEYVRRATGAKAHQPLRILEFGSRNVNGTVRDLFPAPALYVGVDWADGLGVDYVGDAATWQYPAGPVDGGSSHQGRASAYKLTHPGSTDEEAFDATNQDAFDIVITCETFEHTDRWPLIIRNAYRHLRLGGLLIATAAGPNRQPHSAGDGRLLEKYEWYNVDWIPPTMTGIDREPIENPGIEWYENIEPQALWAACRAANFATIVVEQDHLHHDVYVAAAR